MPDHIIFTFTASLGCVPYKLPTVKPILLVSELTMGRPHYYLWTGCGQEDPGSIKLGTGSCPEENSGNCLQKKKKTDLSRGHAQSLCVWVFLFTIWVAVSWSRNLLADVGGMVGVSRLRVTFDSCHALVTLTKPIQTLVRCLMRLRTYCWQCLAEGEPVSMWRVGDCVEVVLLYPLRKWVVPLCAFWCCRVCAVLVANVCGLLVGFSS